MDREEVIRQLVGLGYVAAPRDWALGSTVFVSHPDLREATGTVVSHRDGLYLRRDANMWLVTDLSRGDAEPHARCATWSALVEYIRGRLGEGRVPTQPTG